MIKKLTKKKAFRIIAAVLIAAALVLFIDGVFIEPSTLIERRFSVDLENNSYTELTTDETPESRLKIVTIADLHIGFGTPLSYVKKLTDEINAENPDLILFTGDLKTRSTYLDRRILKATEILSSLSAKYGKFAVYGNHDTFPAFAEIMEKSGFTLLTNDGETLLINGEEVFVGGVNSLALSPRPDKVLSRMGDPDIAIILAHEPDLAAEFSGVTEDALILSGHLHGGQIRIPFLTEWYITSGGKGNLMNDGFYESGDNTVFVSTGIGMSVIPVRIGVPPQFEVIYIQ
jgi:predicted MPP superfamily phosphohydrolase